MHKRSGKVEAASFLLYAHGSIEILGAIMLVTLPSELIVVWAPFTEVSPISFAALSGIGGAFRLFIGYGVWLMRKWAAILGIIFSTTTIVTASQFLPFGVMDLVFAILVLTTLIMTWFGQEVFAKSAKPLDS